MLPQVMIREDGKALHLVHFVYRTPRGVIRQQGLPLAFAEDSWKIACAPLLVEMAASANRPCPWQRTDDPRAVSCPLCQETEQYRSRLAEIDAAVASRRATV